MGFLELSDWKRGYCKKFTPFKCLQIMPNDDSFNGYDPDFLKGNGIRSKVQLPRLAETRKPDIAPVEGAVDGVLHYRNYSVLLSAFRRFPYFTASNIDGSLFQAAQRATTWKKDGRAKQFQWGTELYSAEKSDFDKGHMTKREDVQWGETQQLAQAAADSTFYYTNAVPQHKDLNQKIWKKLEDYVLHTETKTNHLRICVFTGPVLSNGDPIFVTPVNGETVPIPVVFWKVIIFPKSDGKLYRAGFMMSQKQLLIEQGIVQPIRRIALVPSLFNQFDDAETYQVNISLIEQLSGLKFQKATDTYTDDRSTKLVMEEIEVDEIGRRSITPSLGFSIKNLQL